MLRRTRKGSSSNPHLAPFYLCNLIDKSKLAEEISRRAMISTKRTFFCFALILFSVKAAAGINDQLSLHLPLQKDFADISSRKQSIEMQGNVIIRDGAAFFPGKGSWLEVPTQVLNKPFAVSMWIKVIGNKSMYGLVEQFDKDVRNQHFHLMLRGKLQPYLGFYVNDAIAPVSMKTAAWTHLVFQYNGTHQQIWIDGRLLCERKAKHFDGSNGVMRVGKSARWTNVPSHDFEGFMREFRVYSRALSASEIAELDVVPSGFEGNGLAKAKQSDLQTRPELATLPFLSIDDKELTVNGVTGQVYTLQATSNLGQDWKDIATLTNTTGVVKFVDEDALKTPERFYRVEIK